MKVFKIHHAHVVSDVLTINGNVSTKQGYIDHAAFGSWCIAKMMPESEGHGWSCVWMHVLQVEWRDLQWDGWYLIFHRARRRQALCRQITCSTFDRRRYGEEIVEAEKTNIHQLLSGSASQTSPLCCVLSAHSH